MPVTKGVPDVSRYLLLLPLIALLWPPVLYFHGLYQIRRGRSRIDETFAILFSVLLASALTLGATLYVRVYYRFQPEVAPLWEYSQAVFALFVLLDVLLISFGRAALRAWQERQWAAGENLTRVLVAGTGELGRTVAETLLAHRRLGYRVVGFLGEGPQATGHAGLPVVGTIDDAREAVERAQADQVYVALPLEDHARLVPLVQGLSNECVDLKVVPDVVQYATIRASLEDLDGIPIISLNEVPLQGWSSMVKRGMDALVSSLLLLGLCVIPVLPVLALLVRLYGGKGPVLLRQERMTLDGKTFQIFKFRTMVDEAEKDTGPVFATSDDPRRTRDRRVPAPPQPGRAAAAAERAARRHEPRRAAPGAAALRAAVPRADPAVHAAPPRQERHDGLGAGERLARQHLDREAHRVRPLLHRELVAAPRPQDPDPDAVPRLRPAPRVLTRSADSKEPACWLEHW